MTPYTYDELSRSPQGERGLKLPAGVGRDGAGARRSPQGERGLKYAINGTAVIHGFRRSPQGERGLKSDYGTIVLISPQVAPRKGSVD